MKQGWWSKRTFSLMKKIVHHNQFLQNLPESFKVHRIKHFKWERILTWSAGDKQRKLKAKKKLAKLKVYYTRAEEASLYLIRHCEKHSQLCVYKWAKVKRKSQDNAVEFNVWERGVRFFYLKISFISAPRRLSSLPIFWKCGGQIIHSKEEEDEEEVFRC